MWSSVERIYYDLLQEKMVLAFEQLSAHPSTRGKCAKKKTRKLVLHFSRSIQSILYIGRTWQDGIAFETNYGSLLKTHSVSPFFRTF